MATKTDHIPSYYFWDLDKGKKIHCEYFSLRDMDNDLIVKHPFRINYFAIRWIKKGMGKVMVDHIPLKMNENLLFIGNPSQITEYDLDLNEDLEARLIVFTDDLVSLMGFEKEGITVLYKLSHELVLYPEGHEKMILEKMFDLIFEEYHSDPDPSLKDEVMASMIRMLLLFLLKTHAMENISKGGLRHRNLYRNYIDLLEKNFREIHSVKEYADLLYVSEKTINRACKKLTNLTANKIIQNRIDFEAKRMLVRKEINVKQIGYELGFKSSSHFNKFFKNINDQSPGAFRKSVLG
jgi:AraC-like DNA-binding protein